MQANFMAVMYSYMGNAPELIVIPKMGIPGDVVRRIGYIKKVPVEVGMTYIDKHGESQPVIKLLDWQYVPA